MELFPCDLEILMIDKEMDWEPYKPPQFGGKNVMGDGGGVIQGYMLIHFFQIKVYLAVHCIWSIIRTF